MGRNLSYGPLVYTTQVNNAFSAPRLVSSEVISKYYSPPSVERARDSAKKDVGHFASKSFRFQVVLPASCFAYTQVDSPQDLSRLPTNLRLISEHSCP